LLVEEELLLDESRDESELADDPPLLDELEIELELLAEEELLLDESRDESELAEDPPLLDELDSELETELELLVEEELLPDESGDESELLSDCPQAHVEWVKRLKQKIRKARIKKDGSGALLH